MQVTSNDDFNEMHMHPSLPKKPIMEQVNVGMHILGAMR